jgi:periplasmic divalent cation tolerance protein
MVYLTAPDEAGALSLVRHLVERGLAACGNVFPVRSVYRWKGEVVEEEEAVAILKTRRELVDRVVAEIRDRHPSEVPCVVSYPMGAGLPDYLAWIDEATS